MKLLVLTGCLDEDEMFIKPTCRLLVAFGEAYINYVIRNFLTPPVLSLIEMIMKCTSFPGHYPEDEEISDLTLHFWFVLEDTLADSYLMGPLDDGDVDPIRTSSGIALSELSEMQSRSHNVIMSTDSLEHFDISTTSSTQALPGNDDPGLDKSYSRSGTDATRQTSEYVFTQLIGVLRAKLKYPAESRFQRWNSDLKSKFRSYRRDCADTLRYAHNLIMTRAFITLNECLMTSLAQWESSSIDALQRESILLDMEASLFSLRSLAEDMTAQDEAIIPGLVHVVLNRVPRDQHPRLTQTVISFFGKLLSL